ncbi:hypothetical protein [Stackebrandtia soli]|uniref:hypothetical protein n=1 Tax=Stackebrandtia soli TaxID=1892856 RepID=UPI0039EB9CF7
MSARRSRKSKPKMASHATALVAAQAGASILVGVLGPVMSIDRSDGYWMSVVNLVSGAVFAALVVGLIRNNNTARSLAIAAEALVLTIAVFELAYTGGSPTGCFTTFLIAIVLFFLAHPDVRDWYERDRR